MNWDNPFVFNTPFFYPLKASENRNVFCLQGVKKGCIGNKWVNILSYLRAMFAFCLPRKYPKTNFVSHESKSNFISNFIFMLICCNWREMARKIAAWVWSELRIRRRWSSWQQVSPTQPKVHVQYINRNENLGQNFLNTPLQRLKNNFNHLKLFITFID